MDTRNRPIPTPRATARPVAHAYGIPELPPLPVSPPPDPVPPPPSPLPADAELYAVLGED